MTGAPISEIFAALRPRYAGFTLRFNKSATLLRFLNRL